jgi:hypothetical protein
LTALHAGHVGLLCTAGLLNGVFGEGDQLHIAHWRSVKFVDHWEEGETRILRDRERFSHELTLTFVSRETKILTHAKAKPSRRMPTYALPGLLISSGRKNHDQFQGAAGSVQGSPIRRASLAHISFSILGEDIQSAGCKPGYFSRREIRD